MSETAKSFDSVQSFKNFLNRKKEPTAKYYYAGTRKAQILHARLRTKCSSLNLDLFTNNISDSPLCLSASIEDSQHVFFHCRNYNNQRTDLLNAVSRYKTPILNLLLYGDSSLPLDISLTIFEKGESASIHSEYKTILNSHA